MAQFTKINLSDDETALVVKQVEVAGYGTTGSDSPVGSIPSGSEVAPVAIRDLRVGTTVPAFSSAKVRSTIMCCW